jgi:hypothetical protein
MKFWASVISIFGCASLGAAGVALVASFVTFHPRIEESARHFLIITHAVWIAALLITLAVSLVVVPRICRDDRATVRALRRRGLWFSLPQLVLAATWGVVALQFSTRNS